MNNNLDEVKQRLDIVDVISSYLQLDKAGRNFKARCPFHQEKTPSFIVFPERQSWRCFGCGAGGDAFTFVMKKENLLFGDALKMLAEKAGVSLAPPRKETPHDRLLERIYQANDAAALYYHGVLLKEPVAEAARAYVKKRGLSDEAVAGFRLGYAPGDGLRRHLVERGFSDDELKAAGLVAEKEGRIRDLFWQRLLFPIADARGRVVGFGGRSLGDAMPKYLNTPQTAVFDKSSILYGLDKANAAIREQKLAVIVEGYMDAITAHQYGMTNVIASMGTAITEKQLTLLKGLTTNLAFALDPDTAGNTATLRGIEVVRRSLDREEVALPGILGGKSRLKADIRIVPLPQGKDPDEVIKASPDNWTKLVKQAVPLLEYLMGAMASGSDLSTPQGKSRLAEQLLPVIGELRDEVERELYLGKLARLVGISEKTLMGMAARQHPTRKEKRTTAEQVRSPAGDRLEEYCICRLLQHRELRKAAGALSPEHFERIENREVFLAWRDAADPAAIPVNPALEDHFHALTTRALPPADTRELETALADCIRRLEQRRLELEEPILTEEGAAAAGHLKDNGEEFDPERLNSLNQKATEFNTRLRQTQWAPDRSGKPGEDR